MKAYKVELLIVDFDEVGPKGIAQELENARYGNRCMSPQVMAVEGADIGEWSDEHPLNRRSAAAEEYKRLFGR
jgi:hypothetical protein